MAVGSSASHVNLLHLLAASNSVTALDAVTTLLRTGQKQVDELEVEGLTALHVAAAWDNLAMCQLLIHYGADPFRKDENGRTAQDIAKGSVKKFLDQVYRKDASGKGGTLKESVGRALRRLFSCTSPFQASTAVLNRSRSWSPQYRRKNSYSEEEKKLRLAFRKNQPLNRSTKNLMAVPTAPIIPPANKPGCVTFESDSSFVTARESAASDNCAYSPSNKSVNALSQSLSSMQIRESSSRHKDWMTEESDKTSGAKILEDVLRLIHQLTDRQLKEELVARGEIVGPLTSATRRVYEKKLARMIAHIPSPNAAKSKYSRALEMWLAGKPFAEGKRLDEAVIDSFKSIGDPSKVAAPSNCSFKEFVDAIFYVGKGKRSRPLQHIVDAVRAKKFGDSVLLKSKKLQRIADLWSKGFGVVSLHVFQNIVPAEAFTREASMIDAIGISNLTNVKRGDYYGVARDWTMKEKTIYGSYLLANALEILHIEGCRQIFEADVREN